MRPSRRGLGVAALAAVALAVGGWRFGILWIERTAGPGAPPPVTCPGALDSGWAGAAARARAHLAAVLEDRAIPGLTVAVEVHGRRVWSEGLGYADRERGIPACPQQQFRLQSVSKLVTAAVMMRLVEQGALDLDAPVATWLDGLPPDLRAVTPRQLASHRAGVRHYRDDNEALNTTAYATATASLEKFRDDPLLFPPDSGSAYSSYGYVLLSAVLEGAAHASFPALVTREVAAPLGLASVAAERGPPAEGQGRVTFYDHVTPYVLDGQVRPSPTLDFSSKWGGGGLLGSAEAMARFGSANIPPLQGPWLADSTLAVLFAPRTSRFGVFSQGLGWVSARDQRARRVRLHFGAGSGGSSVLAIYPDHEVSVVVLANLGHAGFPMARLLGVAHPFVEDHLALPAWLLVVGAIGGILLLMVRGGPGSPGPAPGRQGQLA